MSYADLLREPQWIEKRAQILSRDKNSCQNCLNSKLYKSGKILHFTNHNNSEKHISLIEDYSQILIPKNLNLPKNGVISVINVEDTKHQILGFREMTISEIIKLQQNEKDIKELKRKFDFSDEKLLEIIFDKDFDIINDNFPKLSEIKNDSFKNYVSELQSIKLKFETECEFGTWTYHSGLHIHHKYYKLETKPWEYKDSALVSLCWVCHEELHSNLKIDIYSKEGKKIGSGSPCNKCFGAGYLPIYRHVDNGRCFQCNGSKFQLKEEA